MPEYIKQCLIDIIKSQLIKGHKAHVLVGHSLKAAFMRQKKIGFDMMMRGFLVKDWREIMESSKARNEKGKMNSLLRLLWEDVVLPMWEQRNEIQQSSKSMNKEAQETKVDEKLEHYYRNEELLRPEDRFIMGDSLDKAKKMNRKTKRVLIKRLDKLSGIYGVQGKEPIKGQKGITGYFEIVERGKGGVRKGRSGEERRRETGPKPKMGRMKSGKKGE